MKISVIGLWHLGNVISASMAELGHDVVGIDFDDKKIDELRRNKIPVNEQGLSQMLNKHQSKGRLKFDSNPEAVKNSNVLIIAYDTPVSKNDEVDTTVIFQAMKKIRPFLNKNVLVVVMSQVPVGTTALLSKGFKKIIYCPENLQLGKAIDCFLNPDRIIIGSNDKDSTEMFIKVIKDIKGPRIFMSIASAEMSKHALNAFLATSLSFTYNISDLCERVNADVIDVMKALKSDNRVGNLAYLDTSLGFSGGTLMRDLRILESFGKKYKTHIPVVRAVLKTNELRRKLVVKKLEKVLSQLSTKKITIYGVTYKPGTSTLRQSISIELISVLKKYRISVSAFDPSADKNEFYKQTGFHLSDDPYLAAEGSHCLLFITPCPEFLNLNINNLKSKMKKPYIFFDTRGMFKNIELNISKTGLNYMRLGKGF
ncbi:MAG: nucleotide sugar dehydrogenase [Minisyncoccia bacterium]